MKRRKREREREREREKYLELEIHIMFRNYIALDLYLLYDKYIIYLLGCLPGYVFRWEALKVFSLIEVASPPSSRDLRVTE